MKDIGYDYFGDSTEIDNEFSRTLENLIQR